MKIPKIPFTLQIILGMLLGVLTGNYFGPGIEPIGEITQWFIQLIKVFAIPLLFLTIMDSMLSMEIKSRGIYLMLGIAGINAFFAISISLLISNIFHPGSYLDLSLLSQKIPNIAATKKLGWAESISTLFPESILGPFVTNSVPAVIIIAVLLGTAIVAVRKNHQEQYSLLQNLIKLCLSVLFQIIEWIVKLTPLAVFAASAKAVGVQGLSLLTGLMVYLLFGIAGMSIQILFVYQFWIRVIGKIKLREFWSKAKEALIYTFGVNSSLATLPLTLKTLDQLKISPGASRLSACIGTNFNNDGILLYEVFAALFIAQANGIHLGLGEQINLAFVSIIATLGVAGIPEAGIIALSLVLSSAGLPLESLAILLTVDWLLARFRSVTNVISDMTVGIGIDALTKKPRL